MKVTVQSRSWLFVPGESEKMLAKVGGLEADAIILDLEDSVALHNKVAARGLVRDAVQSFGQAASLFVRVNSLGTGLTEADLLGVVLPELAGIMLPKTESSENLAILDALLQKAEKRVGLAPRTLAVVPLIESPVGMRNVFDIAHCPRVTALALGGEDLASSLGMRRTPSGTELLYARSRLVMAASAAEIQRIDTVWTDISDEENLRNEAETARNLGFTGKMAIHPRQVPVINTVFSPSPEELARANQIVAALETAGSGVVCVDGKMVDEAVVRGARRIVSLGHVEDRDATEETPC